MQNLHRRDHSKCVHGVLVYLLWHSVVRNRVSLRTVYVLRMLLWTCWVHNRSVHSCTAVYHVVATLYIINFMLYNNMLHQWTTVYISEQCCASLSSTVHHWTALYSIVHRWTALYSIIQHCTLLDCCVHHWTALYIIRQHCTLLSNIVQCWTAMSSYCTSLDSIVHRWIALYLIEQHCTSLYSIVHC